jgi:hypothetical protein
MEKTFKQKQRVGVAGSFINQMMSNNNSLPKIGSGATQLHYTDRTCYEVVEVSEDFKKVKLEYLEASANPETVNEMGHQNWILKPTGNFITVIWRNNAWRVKYRTIEITKEFKEKATYCSITSLLTPEQHKQVYNGDCRPQNVVEGITKESFKYDKINILFGVKNYYYDWSF